MRRALHEFLHIGDTRQGIRDHRLFLRREPRVAGKLFHVIAVGLGSRHATGRGMRLLKKPASERSAITLRIEAGLSPSRFDRASVRDPTGSPVEMNVSTMAVRISRSRLPILGSTGIQNENLSVISNRATGAGGRNCLELTFTNHFRCKSLGFGPKMQYRLDSRNGVWWCQGGKVAGYGTCVSRFQSSRVSKFKVEVPLGQS